jgi:hypothetical protein
MGFMKLRWRRRTWIALCLSLVCVGLPLCLAVPVIAELLARRQAQAQLDEVIAELDQTDPRWRLEDIEADRRQVPTKENGAEVSRAVNALLPPKWPPPIYDELEKVPPVIALRPDQAEALAVELQRVDAALNKAREMKDRPYGRIAVQYAPDLLSTPMPNHQEVRNVAKLLNLDVRVAAETGDAAKAWQANRALLNSGRCFADDPLLISGLIRLAIESMTIQSLERAVAQGLWEPAQLEERQRALQEESETPVFLIGIRGERGGNDLLCSNLEAGKVHLLTVLDTSGRKNAADPSWWDRTVEFFNGSMVLRSHATLLRFDTRMIEAAKLQPTERYAALSEVDLSFHLAIAPGDRSQILARLMFPNKIKIAEAEQRIHTHLACAVAGLAAERYRLKHGNWPDTLDDLVKTGLLKDVPLDLYDGKPLRFRRTPDGLAIYSIGPYPVAYDGRALDDLSEYNPTLIRVEFRLWDVNQRRRPVPD